MKMTKMALMAAICCAATSLPGTHAELSAQDSNMPYQNGGVSQVGFCDCGSADCGGCDSMQSDCGCGEQCDGQCDGGCDSGDCYDDSCDDSCGGGGLLPSGRLSECNLGEPISLLGDCCGYSAGGWAQLGYHSRNLPLFNSRKNEFQLHQGWIYAEKAIDTEGGFDVGGRVDYLYGTDGPDTQAFGIANNHWDNQWDNGSDYGHALPQVYGEAGYGDLSVKFGHFYTLIGYEVVAAPDNFFYSHAYTMYNSEPFTHTGAVFTYDMSEEIDIFGGYVLGWDSGFEDNGDAVLAGSSVQVTDDINVTSTLVAGRFGDNNSGRALGGGVIGDVENGYMQSTVANIQLTEDVNYIFQTDILDTEDASGATVRKTYGINQYLIKQWSDCFGVGARFEWWNVDAASQGFFSNPVPAGIGDYDIFALTLGMNMRPHSNLIFRPEIRWDWVDGNRDELALAGVDILEDNAKRQTTFGIDTIISF